MDVGQCMIICVAICVSVECAHQSHICMRIVMCITLCICTYVFIHVVRSTVFFPAYPKVAGYACQVNFSPDGR